MMFGFAFLASMLNATIGFADVQRFVMVSFSMPETLLVATLKDSAAHQIPAVLNGLHEDSMPKTLKKIYRLSQQIPNLILQIDPTAFERFSVQKVPAFVSETNGRFDVVYGNITVERAFDEISRFGEAR
jgi:type-F conjugative transfer system pilin assembly protein TrbC